MHTTPTGSEEEAEEKEQKKEEQKRVAEEDIIMKSRFLSNAFKCLSPGQTRHMSSSLGNSIQSAIDIAKESSDEALKNVPKMTYYSAWFCPFAHRATLALERHRGFLSYEWVESLGWEKRSKTNEEIKTKHENWYHYKSPDLLKANPLGMVPTIKDEFNNVITESIVCIQYIDEIVNGGKEPILASSAAERAKERVMADFVAKTICSKYYSVLVRQEETEQLEAFGEIEKAIEKFATHLVDDDDVMIDGEKREKGRFFNGRQTPGLVDLTLFPWAWRLPVFETHRDERFKIDPAKSVGLRKYMRWLRDMVSRDDVSRTLPNWEEYLQHITRYADGSARSKVANAVRDGRNAHEYDDEKDDVKE